MRVYTMSIHSLYLVSDLEGSDNGDPINGIICLKCKSRSSLVTVLKTLENVLRILNEVRSGILLPNKMAPPLHRD
jgi:hypothetical protein